jgi:hypothetical protein
MAKAFGLLPENDVAKLPNQIAINPAVPSLPGNDSSKNMGLNEDLWSTGRGAIKDIKYDYLRDIGAVSGKLPKLYDGLEKAAPKINTYGSSDPAYAALQKKSNALYSKDISRQKNQAFRNEITFQDQMLAQEQSRRNAFRQYEAQVGAEIDARKAQKKSARGGVLGSVLGVIGGAAGFMLGGPAGAAIGMQAGSGLGSAAGGS